MTGFVVQGHIENVQHIFNINHFDPFNALLAIATVTEDWFCVQGHIQTFTSWKLTNRTAVRNSKGGVWQVDFIDPLLAGGSVGSGSQIDTVTHGSYCSDAQDRGI